MTKFKLLLVFLLFYTASFAQKENANWCFGWNARVDFNTAPPGVSTSAIGYGHPGASDQGASVSNSAGQLLFYCDGINVWDNTHTLMPNGNDLYGYTDVSWEQKVLIIPKPGSNTRYYIITLGTIYYFYSGGTPTGRGGIHYSVVDMTLNSGKGDIVPGLKNIPLLNHNGTALDYPHDYNATFNNPIFVSQKSRMTTTLHADKDKIWLSIIPDYFMNWQHTRYFYNYLVSSSGIGGMTDGVSPAPTVSTLMNPGYYTGNNPYAAVMKISPNGQYMCDVEDVVNLYDYNNLTGTISFNHNIYTAPTGGSSSPGYGVEFSPNSQLVYFTDNPQGFIQGNKGEHEGSKVPAKLYQSAVTGGKAQLLYTFTPPAPAPESGNVTPLNVQYPFGIQLGMDNKIYTCAYGNLQEYFDYLGVINQPDVPGTGCNFVPNGLALAPGTKQNGTLPQWVHKEKQAQAWPKVYERGIKWPGAVTISTNSNILFSMYSVNVQNNVNHNGPLPPNGSSLIQYNALGVTSWANGLLNASSLHLFPMQNGNIRMIDYNFGSQNFTYFNSATGVASPGPFLVPSNEYLIAETNSGAYITTNEGLVTNDVDYKIFIRSLSGTTYIQRRHGIQWFNPATNKFFISTVITSPGGSVSRIFEVYQVINNAFSLITSTTALGGYAPAFIDNQDRAYVEQNGILYRFDYYNNTFTVVSMPGFVNGNLYASSSMQFYTRDKYLVYNTSQQKFYLLNFNTQVAKSIPAVNLVWCNYQIDGDNLYMSGTIAQNPITIGQQVIAPVVYTGPVQNSNFITKLSINNDFSFRNSSPEPSGIESQKLSFGFVVSPNPAGNTLSISITEKSKEQTPVYRISVIDQTGLTRKHDKTSLSHRVLDISGLAPGVYYIEVINEQGERSARPFMKL